MFLELGDISLVPENSSLSYLEGRSVLGGVKEGELFELVLQLNKVEQAPGKLAVMDETSCPYKTFNSILNNQESQTPPHQAQMNQNKFIHI